jgi:hypothetical protein
MHIDTEAVSAPLGQLAGRCAFETEHPRGVLTASADHNRSVFPPQRGIKPVGATLSTSDAPVCEGCGERPFGSDEDIREPSAPVLPCAT